MMRAIEQSPCLDYSNFGTITLESAPGTADRYGFTGRELDAELNLEYYRNRYTDLATRRWMSQDPIGFSAGDPNLYRYVGNNPANLTDPSGLASVSDYLGAGGRTALTFANPLGFAARAYFDADGLERDLNLLTGGTSRQVLTSQTFGTVVDTVDQGAAGYADALTAGASTRLRGVIWGETATRNHQGTAFNIGQAFGTVHSIALAFVNPCGASNLISLGTRGLNAVQMAGNLANAYDAYQNDDYLNMGLNLLGAAGNASFLRRVCFAGETPIITRRGAIRFDELAVGDEVLSGPEDDATASPRWRQVEEIFRNELALWHVHVRGQVIRTTAEHPFYVWGKGWVEAWKLRPDDLLRSHDGQFAAVKEVSEGGYVEAVYNCRISEDHTYFVGGEDWGFSVWAHNACHGNSFTSTKLTTLYALYSNTGAFLKFGITSSADITKRYGGAGGAFLKDKFMLPLLAGSRKQMGAIEKNVVNQAGGPLRVYASKSKKN